jgi:hypothetical protein
MIAYARSPTTISPIPPARAVRLTGQVRVVKVRLMPSASSTTSNSG